MSSFLFVTNAADASPEALAVTAKSLRRLGFTRRPWYLTNGPASLQQFAGRRISLGDDESAEEALLARARQTGTLGGYGRLIAGRSIVVADSGLVPDPEYAQHAHASALAFEFSHGRDLVVGNCGPAPSGGATVEREWSRS